MIILKTVTISEEKEVCNFLNKYFPKQKEVCTWNSLLSHDWGKDEPFGYVLIDETRNNVIVGFIATIFANRTIDGKIIKTCSLSTWAVNETFRGKGLSMVSKLTKRKNILFLNFSANGISRKIFEFYGFKTLEKEVWTFFSCPILNKKKPVYYFEKKTFFKFLSKEDKVIFTENRGEFVNSSFINFGIYGNLFVIFKKKKQKKMPFLEILYLSSYTMNQYTILKVLKLLSLKFFSLGIIIDSRMIEDTKKFHLIKNVESHIYKNTFDYDIDLSKIDLLYSEKILLCE